MIASEDFKKEHIGAQLRKTKYYEKVP